MWGIIWELIKALPETQQAVLVSSTHATCFGHSWPSSGIKYMILETQNKMHIYIYICTEFMRSHKFCIYAFWVSNITCLMPEVVQ